MKIATLNLLAKHARTAKIIELITADEEKAIDYIDRKMEEKYGFSKEMITEMRENDELEEYYLLESAPFEE